MNETLGQTYGHWIAKVDINGDFGMSIYSQIRQASAAGLQFLSLSLSLLRTGLSDRTMERYTQQ